MRLTEDLAQKIVNNSMNVLGKNINIMNHHGIIIGSGDKNRVNTYHEVAAQVVKIGKSIVINSDEVKYYKGVKAGINLPIKFNDKIIGVVGITGETSEVSGYGEIVKNMVELILQREFLRSEIEFENKFKENIFQQLLSNSINDREQLKDRIQLLEIEDNIPRVIILIQIEPYEKLNISNKIKEIYHYSFIEEGKDIMMIRGENLILIKALPEHNTHHYLNNIAEKLESVLRKEFNDFVIGIGDIITQLAELFISYKGAKLALKIGNKIYHQQEKKLFYINHLGYDYLLPFIEEKSIEHYLHYLLDYDVFKIFEETDTGQIIEALVNNDLNISKTADDLFIHRNTLIYRLDKIKETVGLDPKKASDLFSLLIGYHLYLFTK